MVAVKQPVSTTLLSVEAGQLTARAAFSHIPFIRATIAMMEALLLDPDAHPQGTPTVDIVQQPPARSATSTPHDIDQFQASRHADPMTNILRC